MTGDQNGGVDVFVVVLTLAYAACVVVALRHAAARTPDGIVRRLFRTGRPVTVTANPLSAPTWDPLRPSLHGFHGPGRATYSLDDPHTVRVVFRPKHGEPVERVATIPASLMPDTPETRRRRRIARLVIAVYLLTGVAAFAVTMVYADGPRSLRIRTGALTALAVVAAAWLITHVVLTRSRRHTSVPPAPHHPRRSRHLLAWLGGYLVVSTALGVGWHLANLDQPHPMSWATSFLSAAVFVLASGAAVAASVHHHAYVHHHLGERPTEKATAPRA